MQIVPSGGDAISQALAIMAELRRLAALQPDWDWARVAVIARAWKMLEPVRSYCELHGIPVQMADEDTTQFWRLRETQSLVDHLRGTHAKLLDQSALRAWLEQRAVGPWWELLSEAVQAYALETSAAELPLAHFIDWLAEWGRELRRRQSGLLLLTAHRAKGLEFDHVAVLDGDWDRIGRSEDADAPRRLLYVAMTRARETLALAHMTRRHGLLDALPQAACLVRRAALALPVAPPEMARHYQRLAMKDVNIGYAGGYPETAPLHQAIATLAVGDTLLLRRTPQHWELANGDGITVGRLARAYAPPPAMRCCRATVHAVVVRRRDEGDAEFSERLRCERWEVVLPELVFEPH